MTRWIWHIKQTVGTLWFRASVFGIISVLTALVAYYFKGLIPEDFSQKIGAEAVDSLLNIIATTMLAVTTFSMSTMVAAYSAATNNVTPRSTRLLLQDSVSQTVLSTFLGAFIFSLVGIIALKIGIYGDGGRLILFAVTIVVLIILVATLIRWIEYLSKLGRMGETINLVENAARTSLEQRLESPYLGGVRFDGEVPGNAVAVMPSQSGYIQLIDMGALSSIADKLEGAVYVNSLPGTFVHPRRPLAYITGVDAQEFFERVDLAFVVADDRSFEQDPRFGVIVLAEICSRALSSAINDVGTPIDVIWTTTRVLMPWAEKSAKRGEQEPDYPNVYVPPIKDRDLLEDAFLPVARDGAGLREVMITLQKALGVLARYDNDQMRDAAIRVSDMALLYAEKKMVLPQEYEELLSVAKEWRHN